MRGKAMVMHIRHCTNDRIEIPFHIDGLGPNGGWDRSRTWIVSRTGAGLRLKHDHRHADGTRSEEHTSELQSLMRSSYAVFCLKQKKKMTKRTQRTQNTKTTQLTHDNIYTDTQ